MFIHLASQLSGAASLMLFFMAHNWLEGGTTFFPGLHPFIAIPLAMILIVTPHMQFTKYW